MESQKMTRKTSQIRVENKQSNLKGWMKKVKKQTNSKVGGIKNVKKTSKNGCQLQSQRGLREDTVDAKRKGKRIVEKLKRGIRNVKNERAK